MAVKPFVKSADTSTSVANSRGQLDKMLRRYGASAISMAEDLEARRIVVAFVVPDSMHKDAAKVPVKLPVSVASVYHALYGQPTRWGQRADGTQGQVPNPAGYDRRKLEQAERVAWRNLVLWVDAALSAASVGLQTVTEAFFAHAVVGADGARMMEVVEACQGQLGAGVQRLLTAPADP